MDRTLDSLAAIAAALDDLPPPDPARRAAAEARNAALTKPPGALGRLEDLAIWHAGWRAVPRVVAPQVVVFAGNHGVAARGVSAFPAAVTAQMVENFRGGGAAINQMAALAGAEVEVHALDLDRPTADFTDGPAMGEAELATAFATGWAAVSHEADLLVCGEMGIGNTTAAAALAAHLWGGDPALWVGAGTGVDGPALEAKRAVVRDGLARHAGCGPLEALAALGGRELAAIAGAVLRARHLSLPVILDGFITCAAASTLERARPGALDHAVAGHLSAEAGHGRLLNALGRTPLLALDMRLGEGTGAALAIQVMRGALACQSGMASFAEAGISGG